MQKQVKVKPNSKRQSIEESTDGQLTVHLKSPPVDGKANKELIELLADKYHVPKSQIRIKLGLSSRNKLVEIDILQWTVSSEQWVETDIFEARGSHSLTR